MAKLYFYYSAMNAGKSTILLQSSYNYRERGMNTLILQPEIDTRFGTGTVASHIGISAEARTFHLNENLFHIVEHELEKRPLHCVLVDEVQFLTQLQAKQLSDVCDTLNIPVLAYGLRTDFQGNLFEGSQQLRLIRLKRTSVEKSRDIGSHICFLPQNQKRYLCPSQNCTRFSAFMATR